MQKKMLIIVGVIVVLFVALYFVIDYKNDKALEGSNNPYGTTDLEQATIDQLDDPNYGNQILPDDLIEAVESGEPVTVYYYSPTCVYCQNTTPYLAPLADEMGVDMKKLNLLEFAPEVTQFSIQSTPTLVHYKDGKEVTRIEGQAEEEVYAEFFEKYVLN